MLNKNLHLSVLETACSFRQHNLEAARSAFASKRFGLPKDATCNQIRSSANASPQSCYCTQAGVFHRSQ
jgi:hypothetical protein